MVKNEAKILKILKSNCECKKHQDIIIKKYLNEILIELYDEKNKSTILIARYIESEFRELRTTCNFYNQLRRGSNQKIISFSLYGKNKFYYNKLKTIVKQVQKFYPGWLIRIYHDNSIYNSAICELECQRNDKNSSTMIDIVDFCNIENIYFSYEDFTKNKKFNANYVHSMIWRWLFFNLY